LSTPADFQDRALQMPQTVQAEFLFAVEAAQAIGRLMIEQAGGGHQPPGGQVAHSDVLTVGIVVVDVQTQLGALERGVEFGAEHGEAQGLGLVQSLRTGEAFGLQTAFGTGVARACDLSHCKSPKAGR
jgi:hypothetical protein